MSSFHVNGPCQAAYSRGCRCDECRQAWREGRRRTRNAKPSPLAREVERLNTELDAQELHLEALREENAMLRARLDELEAPRSYSLTDFAAIRDAAWADVPACATHYPQMCGCPPTQPYTNPELVNGYPPRNITGP